MADVKEADHHAAVAAATETGTKAGLTAGAAAERERIAAIMSSDEAAKRPLAARELAFSTDMPLDKAKAFLGKLPEEKVAAEPPAKGTAARAMFDAAMAHDNPEIHAAGGAEGDERAEQSSVILRDYASAGGRVKERKTA